MNDQQHVTAPAAQDVFVPGRISFHAATTPLATDARNRLVARYGDCPLAQASVAVTLGGDGSMLETIHRVLDRHIPVYGMNCGSVGFLMNPFSEDDLPGRLTRAQAAELHPLRMLAVTRTGEAREALAFNEVSLLRQLRQSAKIRITVDGRVRLAELSCDGVLISTPAGSTAYNLSAHGPIVPLSANLLPLTPISAFRPRRWRGALLPASAHVVFEVLEADKRPTGRRRGLHRGARRRFCRGERGSFGDGDRAVRSGSRVVGTDHRRAIHCIIPTREEIALSHWPPEPVIAGLVPGLDPAIPNGIVAARGFCMCNARARVVGRVGTIGQRFWPFDSDQSFAGLLQGRIRALCNQLEPARMSASHPDQSFDSGENHLKPMLIAVLITAVTVTIALALIGLPH